LLTENNFSKAYKTDLLKSSASVRIKRYKIIRVDIPEDVLKKLKAKTGEKTAKDAIFKAVEHYIGCSWTESNKRRKKRKAGRHPVYLAKLIKLRDSSE